MPDVLPPQEAKVQDKPAQKRSHSHQDATHRHGEVDKMKEIHNELDAEYHQLKNKDASVRHQESLNQVVDKQAGLQDEIKRHQREILDHRLA